MAVGSRAVFLAVLTALLVGFAGVCTVSALNLSSETPHRERGGDLSPSEAAPVAGESVEELILVAPASADASFPAVESVVVAAPFFSEAEESGYALDAGDVVALTAAVQADALADAVLRGERFLASSSEVPAAASAAEAAASAAGEEKSAGEDGAVQRVFAPRNFRFVDPEGGRVLSVFFHNSFEPFDSVGCSAFHALPEVCVEHPRCSVLEAPAAEEGLSSSSAGRGGRCGVRREYLELAASDAFCARVAASSSRGGAEAGPVGLAELRAVAADLLEELGVEAAEILRAHEEPDETAGVDASLKLCALAKVLASEVLRTERASCTAAPLSAEDAVSPDEREDEASFLQTLFEQSMGFVVGSAGGGRGSLPPSEVSSPRLRTPRPHNSLDAVASESRELEECVCAASSPVSSVRRRPSFAKLDAAGSSSASGGDAPIRIGINGFGRIGRIVFRIAASRPNMAVTHVNTSMTPEYMAYMLKYDSVHGRFPGKVEVRDGSLFVNDRRVHLSNSRDPSQIDWQASGTDFVCESTGAFCSLKDASQHVDRAGGARHVVISAPAKDEETPTLVVGVNAEQDYQPSMKVVSCASCTTNGLAPLVKVLDEQFGLEEGLMTTVHAVTGTQRVVDATSAKDWRGGRASGHNIIPSSTGAAKAVARCLPHMKGRLTGMALRVPTLDVSVVDLTCRLKTPTSYEDIKRAVKAAADGPLFGILGYTEDPVVSSDIISTECSTVFDANAGIMLNPQFVKVVSWYDNEFAYSARVLDLIALMAAKDGLVPPGTGLDRKPF